ncbi:PREDICTED: mediator of RNA polymerase II transcription subunit 6 isoform X4 [Nicotiana attenuata]|uniref:mediator of RNA polymerase II transcription subunit 6 isoform X4 n=1 Tax=Nicotiana attenuata TaxID=49451 RepID=UPI00090495A6|nr:PREDICTED: mediator of RNA polymerase II transcription subunit 6 isoform X4 [Nicotiana attenuata]
MATTPMMPPMGNPNFDGGAPPQPPQPGTDMTGICFRDQLWLNTYPLDRNLVFDYFALSPFYDWTCNNEQLRSRAIHPLDISHLSKMTGSEYTLSEVMEPHLFVIRKQKRDSPEKVTPMLTYYILDGSIYQAPQLCNVFAGRLWLVKMRVKHLNLSLLRRPLTSRNLSELIISLLPYNESYHQYLHPHHFRKAMHHLPQQKHLKISKQRLSCLQLIPSSTKARLSE